MIVAGIDVGSATGKAVIMLDGRMLAWSIVPTGPESADTAKRAMRRALRDAGAAQRDVAYTVATGYGRVNVPFAQREISEISCHAKGTHHVFPEVRTILDMGGQDCKVIRCGETGKVMSFVMNDKCAAGTGRYLERVAEAMRLPLSQIGPLSLVPEHAPAAISDYCAVFAENDVRWLLHEGRPASDILAGACEAIVARVHALIRRVGLEEPFSISGGIAKNRGVVQRLEQRLSAAAHIHAEPQIVGALGAATLAADMLKRQGKV